MFELVLVVAIALLFDFTNGFHDAANAIATSVATRVDLAAARGDLRGCAELRRRLPVAQRREDHRQRHHRSSAITLQAILAGLVGAITWNLITWWRGLPTSSSHALIGGVAGAAIASTGGLRRGAVVGPAPQGDRAVHLRAAARLRPRGVLALCLAGRVGRYLDARPTPLRGLQLVSAGFVALTHGTNDAQKTMGVIALAMVVSGENAQFVVDDWVIFVGRPGDRAGHVRRRLAHRPHGRPPPVGPRPARRRRRPVGGGVPALARGRLRLPDLDHAGDHRRRARLRLEGAAGAARAGRSPAMWSPPG